MPDCAVLVQFVDLDATELVISGMVGPVALEPLDELGLCEVTRVRPVDRDREHAHRDG